MSEKVTVCGGGCGAHAMAGDLSLRGYKVTLFEHPEFRQTIQRVLDTRTIEVIGEIEGTATVHNATVDPREAVMKVDTLILAVPSYAQTAFFHLILPFLRNEHKVIVTTGNLGSMVLANSLRGAKAERALVGETSTLPYIARMDGPGRVRVIRDKKKFFASAFPAERNHQLISHLESIYHDAPVATSDVIETALNNLNPVAHACGLILNAGSIESAQMSKRNYYLYRDGVTPSVARVIEAVEEERLRAADALGYRVQHLAKQDTVYNVLHDPKLLVSVGPSAIEDRYVMEDVPFGLVPLSGLAAKVGCKTPVINALITIASALIGRNFWSEGRNLSKLGLAGFTVDQLREFLRKGSTS